MLSSPPDHAVDLFGSRAGTRCDQSTSSGTAVSPTGSVGQPPTPVNRHTSRPAIRQRPHSDTTAVQSRVNVHTIAEDECGSETAPTPQNASDSQLPFSPRAARSATTSRRPSRASRRRRLVQLRLGTEARARSEASVLPSKRTHLDRVRYRTKSGSIWYDRLRHSWSQSNESSQCSDRSENFMRVALTPLRPPQPPAPEPIYHQVKIETPFTEAVPNFAGSSRYTATPDNRYRQPRGILRKCITSPPNPLSSLLRLFRTLGGREAQQSQQSNDFRARNSKTTSKLQLPDHRSLLRRNRPAEALKQVTSILEEISPKAVINPLSKRAFSDIPGSDNRDSKKRVKHDKRRAMGHGSPHRLSINRSFSNLILYDSQDSSQLDLRRAPCPSPQNTPEEKAIYRVKRSQSAETEEFLKIDISIRGGTSYLPSEARRVHTPPPPHEGLDGRKRGFFFDYNAPQWSSKRGGGGDVPAQPPGQSNEKDLSSEIVHQNSQNSQKQARRLSTIGRNSSSLKTFSSRFTSKKRDWYDAKLAELEVDCQESGVKSEEGQAGPARRCSTPNSTSSSTQSVADKTFVDKQTKNSEKKKKGTDEQMDYSIPEHLPTSPLCPRNSKYWRVVKGQGSQYRGCWMHGVGEIP